MNFNNKRNNNNNKHNNKLKCIICNQEISILLDNHKCLNRQTNEILIFNSVDVRKTKDSTKSVNI